jgi:hypothetical protein
MKPISRRLFLGLARLRSQGGQAVVEAVLAVPILIMLFAACLQLLHLGLAHIVVELAAYEATRQGTLANMNLSEARRTAEDICRVLGPGKTEVTYQDNPPRYVVTHHLRPLVPIVRELIVSHSLPSYVFLPGYELVPGSATGSSQGGGGGGGGGGSPGYTQGGQGGGSGIEVADYNPADYPSRSHSGAGYGGGSQSATGSGGQQDYLRYASAVNPQNLPGGLAPLRAPPGTGPYAPSADDYSGNSSDEDLAFDTSQADSEYSASGASGDGSGDVSGAGAGARPGGEGKDSSRGASSTGAASSSTSGSSQGGGEGEGGDQSLLERSARAAGEAAGKRAEELGAFAGGAADGYLSDSNTKNAFWAGHRWANEKTAESRARLDQRLSELDAQDKELDKATGLKKITGKASVNYKKLGAATRNIIEEGIYDIPKAGQDLPDAWKNTKAAGKEIMAGNWKAAAKAGGKAAGILAQEAGRASFVSGKLKQLAKGAKAGFSTAARGAKTANNAARAAKGVDKAADVIKAKYVYDAKSNRYRELGSGKYISQGKLPYPSDRGFKYSEQGGIKPGSQIDRFGDLDGRYAGKPGATISERGMPPGSEKMQYKKFEVVKEIPAEIGPASEVPDFGATGGATQYRFEKSLKYYLDNGYLKEIK